MTKSTSDNQSSPRPHAVEEDRREPQAPAPRGNPPADEEAVQKGKQQLDKIAGN